MVAFTFREQFPMLGARGRPLDFVPTAQSKEIAAELEELGYGAIWLPEMAGRDVFVHLCHLLSATRTMVGATGIASMWARDSMAMSCAARALTEAFPERVVVGIGVSHENLVRDVRGHDFRQPLSSLRSYLEAMDKAPYRAERPSTPVHRVVGALGPAMLSLAAEKTDAAHGLGPQHPWSHCAAVSRPDGRPRVRPPQGDGNSTFAYRRIFGATPLH